MLLIIFMNSTERVNGIYQRSTLVSAEVFQKHNDFLFGTTIFSFTYISKIIVKVRLP